MVTAAIEMLIVLGAFTALCIYIDTKGWWK